MDSLTILTKRILSRILVSDSFSTHHIDLSQAWNPETCKVDPDYVIGKILAIEGVYGYKKLPPVTNGNGIVVNGYRYTIIYELGFDTSKIDAIIAWYNEIDSGVTSETYGYSEPGSGLMRSWDTGGYRYRQYIACDTFENRAIRREISDMWQCYYQPIVARENGCLITLTGNNRLDLL